MVGMRVPVIPVCFGTSRPHIGKDGENGYGCLYSKHSQSNKFSVGSLVNQMKWNDRKLTKTELKIKTDELDLPYFHTHPFNGPFPGLPRWAGTRKVKPIWILLKQETVRGSGISWAICKSASRSRQITTPAPHHSNFFTGWMPFLPPNQQRESTEGKSTYFQSVYNVALCRTLSIPFVSNVRL